MGSYRIEKLTFTYPNRERPALVDLNLTIERGAFITLCGPSGCGKSTLLRQLKPAYTPYGEKSGTVYFEDIALSELSPRDQAARIGFVMQSPENQIVTDKVWHELAFGLESLGVKTPEIRLRVAEIASFFGIQTWFHKPVTELSGGQKQLLTLASIMALQPEVLILDEPTSQLDPIAASEFLGTVAKINRELGVTVILTEHRLEEALPLSNRAIVLDSGCVIADGSPREVGSLLRGQDHGMFRALPVPMRVWAACKGTGEAPITVRDGARWLSTQGIDRGKLPNAPEPSSAETAVEVTDVWFRYEKNLPDVIKRLTCKAQYGEITAILGGNGTGKTTALSLIAGLYAPYRGKIHTDAHVYALPQNPQTLFTAKTVREDLLTSCPTEKPRLAHIVRLCRLEDVLDHHPYDLSGGEQQRTALAKVLLLEPKILLLDEPTKGLDAEFKQVFGTILRRLAAAGTAIVLVSHDIEFCAEYADRCALFFDGGIVTENTPRTFFCGNSFYTTSANRMARDVLSEAVTARDIILALGGKPEINPEAVEADCEIAVLSPSPKRSKLSKKRKTVFTAFVLLFIAAIIGMGVHFAGFRAFISGGNLAAAEAAVYAPFYLGLMLAFVVGISGITLVLTWKRDQGAKPKPPSRAQGGGAKRRKESRGRKLSKRTIVAAAMILLSIPLTIYIGVHVFGDRRFYFASMLIMLQTMLPFALVFEGRSPRARELVIIAVLCAIAVAGRAAFFMLPQFKPVVALVIIAGVAFGGEAGFFVGAMSGFVSNMFFGQGPWTPYQMFAFGMIGFLAGVLFQKGLLSRAPVPLAVFGAFATFLIYGGIMNPAAVLMFQPSPTREMFLAAYLQGIPFDLIHAAATVTFLLLISRPMLEKLDRIKVKYGLVEQV